MNTGIVAEALRQADPDAHLATLYAPEQARAALQALYGFDAEIAAMRDRVREPMAGEIRLQWWRDTLAAATVEQTGSPLADALRLAIREHDLPVAALDALLEARIFDLYDDPMPNRGTLEGYLGETRSTVIQLAMQILDPRAARRFPDAAGHGGCALGIAQLLLALPLHSRRGQCFIPADLLAAAGVDANTPRDGGPAWAPAVAAMVALGQEHLHRFREAAKGLPPALRPAVLPLASVATTLARTRKLGAAALERPARLSPLGRQWRMFRWAAGKL